MTSVIIWLIWWLFDDYLMIIWWLFALLWLFVALKYYIAMFSLQKCEGEWLTRFRIRQAMLPHNTGGQACTFSYDSLRFASFIAANRPPRSLQATAVNTLSPYLMIICDYSSESLIIWWLFDWLFDDYLWLFFRILDYLMLIWCLFDAYSNYLTIICHFDACQ